MTSTSASLPLERLRCPVCGEAIVSEWRCSAGHGFKTVGEQPVLIDFDRSIIRADAISDAGMSSPVARRDHNRSLLKRVFMGVNAPAIAAADYLGRALARPARILVVGGGEIGSGAEGLYDLDCEVVAFDVYPSPITTLVADAHHMPFADATFDAVWIQAVLEHVLEPDVVVAEIHRVLKPQGLIFADTPFLQGVHEGAYDFTRFTLGGHRWLFRRFEEIAAGRTGGPGVGLAWSLKGFVRALTGSDQAGKVAAASVGWLRWFDRRSRKAEDFAAGVFFLGRRSETTLRPSDMPAYYRSRGDEASRSGGPWRTERPL